MAVDQSELISQIRSMREQKGLSYQQIADACDLAGESVSKSTVCKIMTAPIDTAVQCRPSSVQAVARAVIGSAYSQTPPNEIAALRAMLAMREEVDRERHQGIVDRQATIDGLQAELKRKSRTIKLMILWASIMTVLLIAFAVILLAYIMWDLSHPGQGILR